MILFKLSSLSCSNLSDDFYVPLQQNRFTSNFAYVYFHDVATVYRFILEKSVYDFALTI